MRKFSLRRRAERKSHENCVVSLQHQSEIATMQCRMWCCALEWNECSRKEEERIACTGCGIIVVVGRCVGERMASRASRIVIRTKIVPFAKKFPFHQHRCAFREGKIYWSIFFFGILCTTFLLWEWGEWQKKSKHGKSFMKTNTARAEMES